MEDALEEVLACRVEGAVDFYLFVGLGVGALVELHALDELVD